MFDLVGRKNDAPAGDVSAAASGVGRMFMGGSEPYVRVRRRRRRLDGTADSFHRELKRDLGQREWDESKHPRDHGKFAESEGDPTVPHSEVNKISKSQAITNLQEHGYISTKGKIPTGASLLDLDTATFWHYEDSGDPFGVTHPDEAEHAGFYSVGPFASPTQQDDVVRAGMEAMYESGLVRVRASESDNSISVTTKTDEQLMRVAEIVADLRPNAPFYYDVLDARATDRGTRLADTAAELLGRGSNVGKFREQPRLIDPEAPGGYASKAMRWLGRLFGRRDFDESKHPRDHGRFTDVAGGDLELTGGAAGRLAHVLETHQGFTYSSFLKGAPKGGKVLSIHPEREKIVEGRVTVEQLRAYHEANKDLLSQRANYVGAWKDEATGKTHLDVSAIVSTAAEAKALGTAHDQIAYWDLDEGKEVRLKEQRARKGLEDGRAPEGSHRRGLSAHGRLPERRGRVRGDKAGREAVERLRAQQRVASILTDDNLWHDIRKYALKHALPVFNELFVGGMDAALRIAQHRGALKEWDEAKHPRDHGKFAESEGDSTDLPGGLTLDPSRVREDEYATPFVTTDPMAAKSSFANGGRYVGMAGEMQHGIIMQAVDAWSHGRTFEEAEQFMYDKGYVRVQIGRDEYTGQDRIAIGMSGYADAVKSTAADMLDKNVPGGTPVYADIYTKDGLERETPTAKPLTLSEAAGRKKGEYGRFQERPDLIDPEAYGSKEDPTPLSLEQRLAQRAAVEAARAANDWWARLEATVRSQLSGLLGPAADPEWALDFGAIYDGVEGLFGPERAQRIAVTETTRVMGQAANATYDELGIELWDWRTAEDDLVDKVCEDMRDNGPYLIDEVFEPAHVNCRCWPVPVLTKEWNEDLHPREHGRFTASGGGDVYHGTTVDAADEILREGLTGSIRSRGEYALYVAKTKKEARVFGVAKTREPTFAIVTVRVPADHAAEFQPTEWGGDYGDLSVGHDIPPEWVVGYDVYDRSHLESDPPVRSVANPRFDATKAAALFLYLVVAPAKAKEWDESKHPREHGRFVEAEADSPGDTGGSASSREPHFRMRMLIPKRRRGRGVGFERVSPGEAANQEEQRMSGSAPEFRARGGEKWDYARARAKEFMLVGRKYREDQPRDHGRFAEAEGDSGDTHQYEFSGNYESIDVRLGAYGHEIEKQLFGKELAPEDYARLAGAPDASNIDVIATHDAISINVRNDTLDLIQERAITHGEDGALIIHNNLFTVEQTPQTEGLGVRALAEEVAEARKLGVARIETEASGSYRDAQRGEWNGYYTWPRMGFDAPLPFWAQSATYTPGSEMAQVHEAAGDLHYFPPGHEGDERLSDLMRDEAGRDYWRQYGASIDVSLDLNGESGKRFDEYAASKGVTVGAKAAARGGTVDLDRTNPGWSDADEAICDRIWGIGQKEWDESKHPRDHGRFASVEGDEGDGTTAAGAEHHDKLNYIPRGPFHTVATATEALEAIARGEYVQLPADQVGTLLEKMADIARDAAEKGEQAPKYDLCQVEVPDTNIFCEESKGIARADMPQIEDKDGFKKYLSDNGLRFTDETVNAEHLKATQRELDGVTVGSMVEEAQTGAFDPRSERIFVSSDNFVLDGHHRWAATVGLDYAQDNKPGDLTIDVTRVNLPIMALLPVANQYDEETGTAKRAVGADTMTPEQFMALQRASNAKAMRFLVLLHGRREWSEDAHPRDEHGRFASGGGDAMGPAMTALASMVGMSPTGNARADTLPTGVPKGGFKSYEDAKAYMKEHYPHLDFNMPDKAAGPNDLYGPVDPKVRDEIIRGLDKMASEFPEVADRISYISAPSFAQLSPIVDPAAWAISTGDNDAPGRGIAFDRDDVRNAADFKETLGHSVRTGFHPVGCDTPESVLVHEFGHQVNDWMPTGSYDLIDKWNAADAAGVSQYARTNYREGFAEAFASHYFRPEGVEPTRWETFVWDKVQAARESTSKRTEFHAP